MVCLGEMVGKVRELVVAVEVPVVVVEEVQVVSPAAVVVPVEVEVVAVATVVVVEVEKVLCSLLHKSSIHSTTSWIHDHTLRYVWLELKIVQYCR